MCVCGYMTSQCLGQWENVSCHIADLQISLMNDRDLPMNLIRFTIDYLVSIFVIYLKYNYYMPYEVFECESKTCLK